MTNWTMRFVSNPTNANVTAGMTRLPNHRLARADRAARRSILAAAGGVTRAGQHGEELPHVGRLLEQPVEPGLDRVPVPVRVLLPRDRDQHNVPAEEAPQPPGQLAPVHPGHAEVHQAG